MFGYFSQSVERSCDLKQNPYFVYDITILEWEKRQVVRNEGRVYLCKNNTDNYEIVCKRDLCYILVLFTSERQVAADRMFDIYKGKINELDPSVPWLHKSNTIAIYKQINRAIQVNSNWTATHIAAKIGLDVYFDANDRIYDDMDQQALPDMMTSFHLAIQNANLNTVRALAEHDANLDLVDISGFNSLHFAAISTPEILMFVLSLPGMFERAKVKTKKGCTPLHLACFARKLENVNIFLRYGLTVSMLSLHPPFERSKPPTSSMKSNYNAGDPVVKFSDSEIDEFEIDFIFYGGTPLHWTKKQSECERFLQLGFDIDALNVKGQTALILKTQRMRFKCLLCLLCQGAKVATSDISGNTALYYAVLQGDITITQALVIFDSDIDHVNRNNVSIRHITSTLPGETINQKMLLYVLASLGAKRCPPDREDCNDGCSYRGKFDGKRFIRWPVFSKRKFYTNLLLKEVIKVQKVKIKEQKKPPEPNLINMVAFDGGGVKGLITIQMIHELQKRLKRPFIDYFDWISGTSTGSIIAISLLLGKTSSQIRSLYFRFKDKIMTGSRPYSSEKFESLLIEELGTDMKMVDLYERFGKFVLIPATMVDRLPVQLHLFRSYPLPVTILGRRCTVNDNRFPPMADYKDQLVWQAVRSSAAAPTYFTSFGRCIDGGILSNNPTMDMMLEFNDYNYAMKRRKLSSKIKKVNAVVSFGTGQANPRPFTLPELSKFISWNPREITNNLSYVKEIFTIIIDSACNTDYHVVERNEAWCASNQVPMFRLNPELIEVMSLNEVEDGEIINSLWLTRVYMHSKKDAIEELVIFLENAFANRKKSQSSHSSKSKTQKEPTLSKSNTGDSSLASVVDEMANKRVSTGP